MAPDTRVLKCVLVAMGMTLLAPLACTPHDATQGTDKMGRVESASTLTNTNYPGNLAPLAPTPFIPLPVGVVRADGWLLTQLQLQRDGATGAAESMYGELGSSSPWLGGSNTDEAWGERAPYYVKGLVALANVLDDATLKARAQPWLDWTLNHQGSDGFLGPPQLASSTDGQNMWGRVPMLYALRDYYEATGDPRVLPALTNFFHWEENILVTSPLTSWAQSRVGDLIDVVHWLYNRTGEASLLTHSDALRSAAYPLTSIYTNNGFFANNSDIQPKHNVNVQQDIKMPAIISVRTNQDADRNAFMAGRDNLFHQHGQIHGGEAGNEMLSGNSSTTGIELCAIVERMESDEEAQMILGDPELGDQLERMAFNALPGAITKDFHNHQYFTLPNQVQSVHGTHGYEEDYGNALMPSPTSGYPCCRFNMHMGWPYFVKNMWAATHDGGLAIMAYGPSHLTAKVANGVDVTMTESTSYPFEEQIRLTVNTASSVTFPLELRIPAWARSPSVLVNGVAQAGVTAASYYTINRTWADGDTITVNVPMAITTSRWINHSVGVERGPLVYSLQLAENQTAYAPGGDVGLGYTPRTGYSELELRPGNPWQYALVLDPTDPGAALGVNTRGMPTNPFIQATTPVYLTASAKLVGYWGMDPTNGILSAEPPFPAVTTSPTVSVNLVPFGAENIRVSYFPLAVVEGARFEAETGSFAGGAVFNDNNPGYSGTGFADFRSTSGASVTITGSDGVAGPHYLSVHYSAGAGTSTTTALFVNSASLPSVTLAGTTDWTTWADSAPILVTLNASSNAFQIVNNAGSPINVDYVSLTPFTGALYEGERATLAGGAIVQTNHPRYSGTGFVDFVSTNGASATFNVAAANAGPQNLVVHYAAGQGSPVTGTQLSVNGVSVATPAYASTGSWTIWQDSDPYIVTLKAGNNTLELLNTTAPYMNIDYITLTPSPTVPCVRGLPTVSLAPSVKTLPPSGGSASYSVTITNHDRSSCAAAQFHFDATALQLGGVTTGFSANEVTLTPGSSTSATLTVTAPSGSGAGSYLVSTTVRNDTSSQLAVATASLALGGGVQIEAETMSSNRGLGTESCSEGGLNVMDVGDGEWAAYGNVLFDNITSFQARTASGDFPGTIEFHKGSSTGQLLGTCSAPNSGGWQRWTTISCPAVSSATGMDTLYLVFHGGSAGSQLPNLNWFKLFVGGAQIEAESFNGNGGVGVETCSEGGINVMDVGNGEWASYDNVSFTNVTQFTARVASANFPDTIEFRKDSLTGLLLATCSAPYTGGWQTWTSVTCPAVASATGTGTLFVVFHGASSGSQLPNVNWVKLQ